MRGHDRGYLFSGGRLSETLDGHRTAALNEVERVPKNQFLGTTVDTLVESICSKAAIEKPWTSPRQRLRLQGGSTMG
jgi:hypothetical protein